jgi:hypothetical protein
MSPWSSSVVYPHYGIFYKCTIWFKFTTGTKIDWTVIAYAYTPSVSKESRPKWGNVCESVCRISRDHHPHDGGLLLTRRRTIGKFLTSSVLHGSQVLGSMNFVGNYKYICWQKIIYSHIGCPYNLAGHVKDDEMAGACGTHGKGEKSIQGFGGKARRKETPRKTEV